jgi:hypothetical protein
MITQEETTLILNRSFQYLVALMVFSLIQFRLQINCYLYEEFKDQMKKSFLHKGSEVNWNDLLVADPMIADRICTLDDQITHIESSLQEVQKMSQNFK